MAAVLLCHISIIMALSRKEPPSPRPRGDPQQLLCGKNAVCGRCCRQRWPRSQNGTESCLGGQCRIDPCVISLWCWQVVWPSPNLHLRANTARARGSRGCRGLPNTPGLGHVLWTAHIWLPTTCTRCQIPLPLMLFQYEHARSYVWWVQRQGSLTRAFRSCISLGPAPFLLLLLGPFLVFSSFVLFLSHLKGPSKAGWYQLPSVSNPQDCLSLCFP